MNDIFQKVLRKFVLVFFDDILIYSKNWADHLHHIAQVFEILLTHHLFVRRDKCQFGKSEVCYLGHIISPQGVAMDPEKIESVMGWPKPTTLKELRGFLGLTGYYRKFVRGYGAIAKPLTELLKKNAFEWSSLAEESFNQLKLAMTQAPLLALPDFSKHFVVECDASGMGIGAVLLQENRPIAYFSKAIKGQELGLSTYEKEMLALVSAVQR
jgi:hypothetical protein